jgi:hypothetical protein
MSLHRVVNMAMSHLQAGKSVVIGMLAQTPSRVACCVGSILTPFACDR